ncbi:MAG: metalloregulator ArsR/SmtB family transcription factor [Pyrinomonadaceae bacterium]|nr:metalloregulator ArsR/SmtB family transcription factor [Pyrinomonadaceae bacterium]
MSDGNHLVEMESLFLALADKTRLRILNLMREDEVCVCFFTEVLGESQPKISRHLAYLRNAGLVSARREGKWMNYQIEFPKNSFAAGLLENTLRWLKMQDDMREDYEKLAEFCCAVEVPVTISRAPTPKAFAQTNMSRQPKEELDTFLL